jgi:hypothetical protein
MKSRSCIFFSPFSYLSSLSSRHTPLPFFSFSFLYLFFLHLLQTLVLPFFLFFLFLSFYFLSSLFSSHFHPPFCHIYCSVPSRFLLFLYSLFLFFYFFRDTLFIYHIFFFFIFLYSTSYSPHLYIYIPPASSTYSFLINFVTSSSCLSFVFYLLPFFLFTILASKTVGSAPQRYK